MALCASCKSKHRRLVDSIFPVNPDEGIVKNNMEKLTFYVLRRPEKLRSVGDYMFDWLDYSIDRLKNKRGHAVVCLEAVDQLLIACRAQTLNLYVNSFLNMIRLVLEKCSDYDLQVLAITSFIKFTNIEEDSPTHISYDFFIGKFCSMCFYTSTNDPGQERRVRIAGMRGLQGVVKKTYSDGVHVNIWQREHMEKIIPAYLYNMSARDMSGAGSSLTDVQLTATHPPDAVPATADACFRELLCRVTMANIDTVLTPVLTYLDDHHCWSPDDFAVRIIRLVISSTQAQCSWEVVRALLKHLDANAHSSASVLAGITDVLRHAVASVDTRLFGMTFYEVFNVIVHHLRASVVRQYYRTQQQAHRQQQQPQDDEKLFQESIVSTICEVANNQHQHSDQLNEIISFLVGFAVVPLPPAPAPISPPLRTQVDERLAGEAKCAVQRLLLKTVLRVAARFKPVHLSTALPSSLLDNLLRLSRADDRVVRYLVQKILHRMIDRHENERALESKVQLIDSLESAGLVIAERQSLSEADAAFAAKQGPNILGAIYLASLFESNHVDNVTALYTTVALLGLELPDGDLLQSILSLCLAIQTVAMADPPAVNPDASGSTVTDQTPPASAGLSGTAMEFGSILPMPHRCALHSVVASLFTLVSCLLDVEPLRKFTNDVTEGRKLSTPYLLPEVAFSRTNSSDVYPVGLPADDALYFNRDILLGLLDAAGYQPRGLLLPSHLLPGRTRLMTDNLSAGSAGLVGRHESDARSLSASEVSLASTNGTDGLIAGDANDAESIAAMEDLSAETIRSILRPPVNGNGANSEYLTIPNRRTSAPQVKANATLTTKGILRDGKVVANGSSPGTTRKQHHSSEHQSSGADLLATLTDMLQRNAHSSSTTPSISGGTADSNEGSPKQLSGLLGNGIALTEMRFPEEFLWQGPSQS